MVVTDQGKVLKPISTREKSAAAKERWRAVVKEGLGNENSTKGRQGNNTDENSTADKQKEVDIVEKADLVKNGDVRKDALAKEVISLMAKKSSKMKWKKAVAKQSSRNGYKPIMTDQGLVPTVVLVTRESSAGQRHGSEKKESVKPMNIKDGINNGIEINDKDFPESGLDEVDGLTQNDPETKEAARGNSDQRALRLKEKDEKQERDENQGKDEKRGKDEKQEKQRKTFPEKKPPQAQRPSSLKLRSLNQEDQGSQDHRCRGADEDHEREDKDEDQLFSNKKEQAKDLSDIIQWGKGKELEDSHESFSQKGSWTSWQEMAEKKFPTKNLIVFS